jgi:hypothetical protein
VLEVPGGDGWSSTKSDCGYAEKIMRNRYYPSDLTDARWALVAPHIPAAKRDGRPRTTDVRAVFDAIIYLLRTGLVANGGSFPAIFPPGRPCTATSGAGG